MEPSLGFLFAAFFLSWLVLLLYLVVLSGRLSALRRELESLDREPADDPARPAEGVPSGGHRDLES